MPNHVVLALVLLIPLASSLLVRLYGLLFRKVESYFRARFIQKILKNMEKIDEMNILEEKASAA